MKTITRTLLAATLVACAPLALAQGAADYPSRTVRVLVPNSPGGPVDTVGRLTAAFLESRFKQPFVVENRQGANSRIATEAMVKSAPDGYTLLVSPPQLYVFEQMTNKEWPFRYERDYTVVSWIAGAGYAIVAANNFGSSRPVSGCSKSYIRCNWSPVSGSSSAVDRGPANVAPINSARSPSAWIAFTRTSSVGKIRGVC